MLTNHSLNNYRIISTIVHSPCPIVFNYWNIFNDVFWYNKKCSFLKEDISTVSPLCILFNFSLQCFQLRRLNKNSHRVLLSCGGGQLGSLIHIKTWILQGINKWSFKYSMDSVKCVISDNASNSLYIGSYV